MDLPLWSQQQPLWEAAQDVVDRHVLPRSDPQPVGTWMGGTALPMHNGELKVSLWGPPERLTFSLGKTDVWDRRYFPEKPLTLEEIREHCFRDDYAQNPLGKHFESLNAYDFPTPKPVGQLILLMPDLEGAEQPTAATRRGDGVATVPLRSGAIEAVTPMTRNVLAVRGEFAELSGTPQVRVYRHRDTLIPGQSWDHSNGGMRPYPGFDYTRDAPHNGPLDPPASGSDGRYFWITQAMPPEATFPDGFWYVFMATVAGGPGDVETVENQTGLGTDPYMTPERKDGVYPGTTNLWRQIWLDYDRIRAAPGAAATAALPGGEWLLLATVVTSAEAEDPIAEARRVLEDAERKGWDGLVAENADWFEAFYRKREDGRVYYADAERNAGVVNEVAGSWTDAHANFTRPDPLRWELDNGYNYLNHDWAPWQRDRGAERAQLHGLARAEPLRPSEHVVGHGRVDPAGGATECRGYLRLPGCEMGASPACPSAPTASTTTTSYSSRAWKSPRSSPSCSGTVTTTTATKPSCASGPGRSCWRRRSFTRTS